MEFSAQQQAFFEAVLTSDRNILLSAVAGSGKTTTIIEAAKRIKRSTNLLFLAFNKSIATELSARLPSNAEAMTLNALGHRALIQRYGRRIEINARKLLWLYRDWNLGAQEQENLIVSLARLAKMAGLSPSAGGLGEATVAAIQELGEHFGVLAYGGDDTQACQIAIELLKKSIEDTTRFDFDDQLYLPLIHNLPLPSSYDVIIVDEAQDLNAIQHELLARMAKQGASIIAVGDHRQAIYGFRGSLCDSLEQLGKKFDMLELPLSTSYRCCKAVKDTVAQIVPQFSCGENNKAGTFEQKSFDPQAFNPADLVICRNTAPLISLAYRLLRDKVPCSVKGRDIGQGLISIVNQAAGEIKTIPEFLIALANWETAKISAMRIKDPLADIESVQDKTESIKIFVGFDGVVSVDTLKKKIDSLFSDDSANYLQLSTIHRAKGLEANTVWLVDKHLLPSKYAKQPWQLQQEQNLLYVALTRAKENMYLLDSTAWSKGKK